MASKKTQSPRSTQLPSPKPVEPPKQNHYWNWDPQAGEWKQEKIPARPDRAASTGKMWVFNEDRDLWEEQPIRTGGQETVPTTPTAPATPSTTPATQPQQGQQYRSPVAPNDLYNPPARSVSVGDPRGGGAVRVPAGTEGVLLPNGQIRGYYDLNNEPTQIWLSLAPQRRQQIIDIFKSKGFNVSNPNAQLSAFTSLLEQSNIMGMNWQTQLTKFDQAVPSTRTSGGPRYRVSNPSDLKVVARQIFKETMGRESTAEEAERFVQFFQNIERQTAGGAVQTPNVQVAAEEFAQQTAPKEVGAYKYMSYISQLINAVGGTNV